MKWSVHGSLVRGCPFSEILHRFVSLMPTVKKNSVALATQAAGAKSASFHKTLAALGPLVLDFQFQFDRATRIMSASRRALRMQCQSSAYH